MADESNKYTVLYNASETYLNQEGFSIYHKDVYGVGCVILTYVHHPMEYLNCKVKMWTDYAQSCQTCCTDCNVWNRIFSLLIYFRTLLTSPTNSPIFCQYLHPILFIFIKSYWNCFDNVLYYSYHLKFVWNYVENIPVRNFCINFRRFCR